MPGMQEQFLAMAWMACMPAMQEQLQAIAIEGMACLPEIPPTMPCVMLNQPTADSVDAAVRLRP